MVGFVRRTGGDGSSGGDDYDEIVENKDEESNDTNSK